MSSGRGRSLNHNVSISDNDNEVNPMYPKEQGENGISNKTIAYMEEYMWCRQITQTTHGTTVNILVPIPIVEGRDN